MGKQPVDVACRAAVASDGVIATDSIVQAALKGVGHARPSRLMLTVPVAPAETIKRLKSGADEVICPIAREEFYVDGEHHKTGSAKPQTGR